MSKAKEVRELRSIIQQQELVIDWLLKQLEKAKTCAEAGKE